MGATPPNMQAALDRLWARFLPEVEARLALLEAAALALGSGALTPAHQAEAMGAAHKLAGSLGTFGLLEGTEIARRAEHLLASESALGPSSAESLGAMARALRTVVASR